MRKQTARVSRQKRRTRRIRGGAGDTFRVYTTGLVDYAQSAGRLWINEQITESVLRLIPPRYTKIQIVHCDPMGKESVPDIIDAIVANDRRQERVISSTFTKDPLPFSTFGTKDYILIDCAHLFEYHKDGKRVSYNVSNDYYTETTKSSDKAVTNINAVYLGYLPNCLDGDSPKIYKCTYFRVLENGTVETFIDKLHTNGWGQGTYGIEDAVNTLVVDTLKPTSRKDELTCDILNGIWEGKNKETLTATIRRKYGL